MKGRADQPRWHVFVRRTGTGALIVLLTVYAVSPYVGFMAKEAGGPIFIARPGAVGVGYLEPRAMIADIPNTRYVGLYFPTVDPIWSVLVRQDSMGVRVYVPYWIPIGIVVGAMAWVSYAERPRSPGVCPGCGYDLGGCVATRCDHCELWAVTCPECGAVSPDARYDRRSELTPSARTPRPPSPAQARSHGRA